MSENKKKKEKKDNKLGVKDKILCYFDENQNGVVELDDIIIKALKNSKMRVNREEFFKREFKPHCPVEQIDKAIVTNPLNAGIDSKIVDKVADEVINYTRNQVILKSVTLGAVPTVTGSIMAACVDSTQYYGCMIIVIQKLLYLYGFQQLDMNDDNFDPDSVTLNALLIAMGAAFGIDAASKSIKLFAAMQAKKLPKILIKSFPNLMKALALAITKVTGKKISEKVVSTTIGGSVPFFGVAISGVLTYVSFKPICIRLQAVLRDTAISNPNYKMPNEDDIIDIDVNSVYTSQILID